MKIAILQPLVPHYRTEFFNKIREKKEIEIYTYINEDKSKKLGFKIDNIGVNHVKNFFKEKEVPISLKQSEKVLSIEECEPIKVKRSIIKAKRLSSI